MSRNTIDNYVKSLEIELEDQRDHLRLNLEQNKHLQAYVNFLKYKLDEVAPDWKYEKEAKEVKEPASK